MARAPAIITSKTRGRTPSSKMLHIEHSEVGERRVVDPYQADKLLNNQHGWKDPTPAYPAKEK